MNQSAIDIEFLTESGADHYIESVTAAARLVVAALCGASRPGLVAGSSSLRQQIRKLQLATSDGVGLHAVLGEVAELVLPNSTVVSNPGYAAHLHCPPTISSLAAETVLSALNQSMDSYDQGPAARSSSSTSSTGCVTYSDTTPVTGCSPAAGHNRICRLCCWPVTPTHATAWVGASRKTACRIHREICGSCAAPRRISSSRQPRGCLGWAQPQ